MNDRVIQMKFTARIKVILTQIKFVTEGQANGLIYNISIVFAQNALYVKIIAETSKGLTQLLCLELETTFHRT